MRAVWNGVTIARTDETIEVEGNQYFPLESVNQDALRPSKMKSLCYWKGIASYYHVEAGGEVSRYAAWTYRHPPPWIRKIKNRIAFWNGVQVLPD